VKNTTDNTCIPASRCPRRDCPVNTPNSSCGDQCKIQCDSANCPSTCRQDCCRRLRKRYRL
jgi:hypothetical protein